MKRTTLALMILGIVLGTLVSLSPFIWARFVAVNPGPPDFYAGTNICQQFTCDLNAGNQTPIDANFDMPPDCSQTIWVPQNRINIGIWGLHVEAGFALGVERLVSNVPATEGEYCGELWFYSVSWLQSGTPWPDSIVAALKVQHQDMSGNWTGLWQNEAGWPCATCSTNPIRYDSVGAIADSDQSGSDCLTGVCYYIQNGWLYNGGPNWVTSFVYSQSGNYDLYCSPGPPVSPYGASYGSSSYALVANNYSCPPAVLLTGPPTYG